MSAANNITSRRQGLLFLSSDGYLMPTEDSPADTRYFKIEVTAMKAISSPISRMRRRTCCSRIDCNIRTAAALSLTTGALARSMQPVSRLVGPMRRPGRVGTQWDQKNVRARATGPLTPQYRRAGASVATGGADRVTTPVLHHPACRAS